jgi:quinol monooxygenase YgiN
MVIERWESLEALAAHDVAPHMQAYRAKVKQYIRGREIRVLAARVAPARHQSRAAPRARGGRSSQ